jgi:hypothetical protein
MPHDVFISYATLDREVADAICTSLEAQEVRCWIAPRDILPGIPYAEALTEALRSCRILVLVFSAASNGSKHVMREVESAVALGIPVVPFRIGEMSLSMSMNYLLKSIHWLDALTPPLEQHLQTLTDVVQNLLVRSSPSMSAAMRGTDPAICLPHGSSSHAPTPPSGHWGVTPSGHWRVAPLRPPAVAPVWRRWWVTAAVALGAVGLLGPLAWWLVSKTMGGGDDRTRFRPATPPSVRVDDRARALPVGNVLRVVYEHAPPDPDEDAAPVRLQVGLYARRAGDKTYLPLANGDPLASQVDRYWVGIRPLADGYLYVFQVDSQGHADWLYPANPRLATSSGSNPVKANAIIQVPPADASAIHIDAHAGMEHLFVVMSAAPWPALEEALAKPAPKSTGPPAFPDRPLVGANRGVSGTAGDDPPLPFERVTGNGREKLSLVAQTYDSEGSFVVIERRFRHGAP